MPDGETIKDHPHAGQRAAEDAALAPKVTELAAIEPVRGLTDADVRAFVVEFSASERGHDCPLAHVRTAIKDLFRELTGRRPELGQPCRPSSSRAQSRRWSDACAQRVPLSWEDSDGRIRLLRTAGDPKPARFEPHARGIERRQRRRRRSQAMRTRHRFPGPFSQRSCQHPFAESSDTSRPRAELASTVSPSLPHWTRSAY